MNHQPEAKTNKSLPFDGRNAEDFFEITKKIQEALDLIRKDKQLPPTKSTLARLSGVHRNTLRHRALMSCPPEHLGKKGAATYGWPYSALSEISVARERSKIREAEEAPQEATLEDKLSMLEQQLAKSRHQVSVWFNRTIDLKRERDEAWRHVALMADRQKTLVEENERLRRQLTQNLKVVK